MTRIFNECGKGYWMEGFGCVRAEGENRPSRPGHVVCTVFSDEQSVRCDDVIVFIPYGSRLGFHVGGPASTMANIDYKFPQCVCYAIEGNVVDRVSAKNGKGWCENVSPTLNTQDRHAICFSKHGEGKPEALETNNIECYAIENHPQDSRVTMTEDGIVQTLSARIGTGGGECPIRIVTPSTAIWGVTRDRMRSTTCST